MSMRMDAFNDIVNSYSRQNGMLNGLEARGASSTCQTSECSDTTQMIMAFLNIGGQVAMAAAQAKVQGQNQAASNNNAAINNAMKDAQDALIKLPAESAEYTKLKNEIAEIDKQLKSLENLDSKKTEQQNMNTTFANAKVGGTTLSMVTKNIASCTSTSSDLKGFLSQLGTLNSSYAKNKEIATRQEVAKFSSCIGDITFPSNEFNKENAFTEHINSKYPNEYKKKDGDKEVVLESLYKADLAKAKEYDKTLSEKIKADKEYKEIGGENGNGGKFAELWNNVNAKINGLDNSVKSALGLDGGNIRTDVQLKDIISKLDNHAKTLGEQSITDANGQPIKDKDGKPVTVDNYLKNKAELESQIADGEAAGQVKEGDKTGKEALEAKKAALEKQLTDKAKPQLEKLSKAYNELKTMIAAIDNYNKEKGEISTAKQGYKDVKNAEGRNFFQKCLGLGKTDAMKQDRALAKGEIAREKQEASQVEQNFIATYNAKPTAALRGQADGQMKVIQNTVKQAGLAEFAKKLGFNFDLDA